MPFPKLESYTELPAASDTIFTFTAPAGVQLGDMLVVMFYAEKLADFPVTPPPGFALRGETSSSHDESQVWWKRATATDLSGGYTFLINDESGHMGGGYAMRFSGCIAEGHPFDAVYFPPAGSYTGTTPPSCRVTTRNDECLLVYGATHNGADTWVPPAGFTERDNTEFVLSFGLADKEQAAAGDSGPVACTWNITQGLTAFLLSLKSVNAAVTYDDSVATPCTIQEFKTWVREVEEQTPGVNAGEVTTTARQIVASW